MSLVTQSTNLKSLRYGGVPGGQPYIVNNIPIGQVPYTDYKGWFIRGGSEVGRKAKEDFQRIKAWMDDGSQGVLFTAQQNALSAIANRTEASLTINGGIYNPLNTLAQVAATAFGVHLRKQGLPTDIGEIGESIGIGSNFGLAEDTDLDYYGVVRRRNRDERNVLVESDETFFTLGQIYEGSNPFDQTPDVERKVQRERRKEIRNSDKSRKEKRSELKALKRRGKFKNRLLKFWDKDIINRSKNNVLFSYPLGPGGLLTSIRMEDQYRTGINSIEFGKEDEYKNKFLFGTGYNYLSFEKGINDFSSVKRSEATKTIIGIAPRYDAYNRNKNYNQLNPGEPGDITDYTRGKVLEGLSIKQSTVDKINALPIYESKNDEIKKDITNDIIQFRISAIDSKNPSKKQHMHFRAFINNFNDNYNANWSEERYMGRGEGFFKYSGFSREISLSFEVLAQSKQELMPMFQKLNFLASNLAPDYSDKGYMGGSLIELTLGGYLFNQPGIITSLSYEIPQDTPWEIGINVEGGKDELVKELPHRISVNMNFKPIHKFIPRKQRNSYGGMNGEVSQYGKQKFIALADGSDSDGYSGGSANGGLKDIFQQEDASATQNLIDDSQNLQPLEGLDP